MKNNSRMKRLLAASLALSLMSAPFLPAKSDAAGPANANANVKKVSSQVKLRIMETTDLHTNLFNYDYYKNEVSEKLGLVKTATLVKQAREEVENSLLVDNGDLIQGSPLGTYKAKIDVLEDGEVHPMIQAMNMMEYDIATLGNHEFNYGLDFLDEVYDDANFPYINANVYVDDHDNNPNNDRNKYTPYKIINKKVVDEQGKTNVIKIGVIGFVPPQINDWDKAHLDGKVITKDIVETAQKFIPEMRKASVDMVIALAHSGFSGNEANTEDTIYALSKVPGIDAITFSHTHKVFPAKTEAALDGLFLGPDKKPLPGVDNARGTINGVPAVQAGYGGGSLGIIDLTLEKVTGKWSVVASQSSTREASTVAPDQAIVNAVKADHEGTVAYVNTPIGTTTDDIQSYFALVKDDPSIQVVTNAQKWYAEKYIAINKPEYKDLPILSVGAPFKAGRNGVDEYTEIKKGDLTIRSAGDLYLYDNTLKAIKVKGSVVKEWIEMSAGKFNTIDVNKTEAQELLNPAFQVFNFDVMDGVQYQIDVTKPAKYDPNGNVINPDSSRVMNLTYNGQPLDPNQDFIVVTNNYRAGGGGNFPGLRGSELVVDSADENRQILMDYISEEQEIVPTADQNWSIAPIQGDVHVTFTTSPKAEAYIEERSNITYTGELDSKGFGIFTINLGGTVEPPQDNENIKVQLLSVNDLHGKIDVTGTISGDTQRYGRADYLAAYLRENEAENQENTLIVHTGDMVGGSSPVSALLQDEPTVEIMESIGFDVGTVGNHEFDEGVEEMKRLITGEGELPTGKVGTENYDGMNFPLVAANVRYKDSGELVLPPYSIQEVGGVKIGFIGVATTATPANVVAGAVDRVEFIDEADAINEFIPELKAQGVKSIVVLAHVPGDQSGDGVSGEIAALANAVDDEVDVIIAAHNHAKVNGVVDNKLIVQAWEYGKAYADIDLEIDPVTHDIVKKSAEVVDVVQDGMTPDPQVQEILDKYLDEIAPIVNQQVGVAAIDMEGGYGVKGPVGDNALGNLIADGMKAEMNSDFALMNGGGIRDNLDAGPITWGELFNIQPFNNTLVKVDVTGAGLEDILNAQISAQYGPDCSVAGFKYTWDGDTSKVVDIFLPDGSKIDKNATYTLTVNNYMAFHSTDKYKIQANGSNVVNGPEDLEATVNYVKNYQGNLAYEAEGRISQVTSHSTDLGAVSIHDARAAGIGKSVMVEGIATSDSGGWGSKGFYLQDGIDGVYVHQSSTTIAAGDHVRVAGKTGEYNGGFQIADVTSVEKLGTGTVPTPEELTPAQATARKAGTLVSLKGVTISDLESVGTYGSFQFKVNKGIESVLVFVDNRTGLKLSDFTFVNGAVVDITGVVDMFNGTVEVKTTKASDIVAAASAPVTTQAVEEAAPVQQPAEAMQQTESTTTTL